MSRKLRVISESGMYHIIFRGNNKQNIFRDEQDFKKIKGLINDAKMQLSFEVYAYCFMTNHVHMLIKEKASGDISLIMKKILTRYAMWFNNKYHRSGGLFEDRYKALAIEDDDYVCQAIRYIHYNPLVAGIANKLDEYPHSSYAEYYAQHPYILDKEFVMAMLGNDGFNDLHSNDDIVATNLVKITDDELTKIIIAKFGILPKDIALLNSDKMIQIISQLKKILDIYLYMLHFV